MKSKKISLLLALFWIVLFWIAVPGGSQETVTREIPVTSGERLEIDLRTGGSLEITGWSRDAVAVEARVLGRDAEHVELAVEPSGDGGARISSRFSERRRSTSIQIRIRVHVPLAFDVDLDTMGGDVTVRDLDGRVSGKTMGGDLELSNLRGELALKTMGGDVRVVDSELDGKVTTMGGRVLLRDIHGDLVGKSMGGDVKLENVVRRDGSTTGGEIHISTMGGRLDVEEAPDGASLHTKGGAIKVRSASRFVKAKTLGGDVTIDAVDGWVKATTMAGDVNVTMVGDPDAGRRDVDIFSATGNVTLTVPRDLDMTIDVELAYTRDRSGGAAGKFRIESDFPLEIRESREWDYDHGSPRKYILGTGTVGAGTHTVKIRAVNGNVRLKRGR